jgi:hypothetical protein
LAFAFHLYNEPTTHFRASESRFLVRGRKRVRDTIGNKTVEIRELRNLEIEEAARLLSRGMRDNPINIAAFGVDPMRRQEALARFFQAAMQGLKESPNAGQADKVQTRDRSINKNRDGSIIN